MLNRMSFGRDLGCLKAPRGICVILTLIFKNYFESNNTFWRGTHRSRVPLINPNTARNGSFTQNCTVHIQNAFKPLRSFPKPLNHHLHIQIQCKTNKWKIKHNHIKHKIIRFIQKTGVTITLFFFFIIKELHVSGILATAYSSAILYISLFSSF